MKGVDKEAVVVAKHADILLAPFFEGDGIGGEMFASHHRYWVALNLSGVPCDDEEGWKRAEWTYF